MTGISATDSENKTLFAKWTAQTFTVTFDTRGDSAVAPIVAEFGSKVQKPADPTRDGYAFAGWFTDEVCTHAFDFTETAVSTDFTIYANWTQNTVDPSKEEETQTPSDEESGKGCGSAISTSVALFGGLPLAAAIVVVVLKKKKTGK